MTPPFNRKDFDNVLLSVLISEEKYGFQDRCAYMGKVHGNALHGKLRFPFDKISFLEDFQCIDLPWGLLRRFLRLLKDYTVTTTSNLWHVIFKLLRLSKGQVSCCAKNFVREFTVFHLANLEMIELLTD